MDPSHFPSSFKGATMGMRLSIERGMGGSNIKRSKKVVRMGMDLGRNTFHLVGVEESGKPAVKKKKIPISLLK